MQIYALYVKKNLVMIKMLLKLGITVTIDKKCFKEPVPLDKKYYYSEFNDTNISDSDIEHVKKVCEAFNITNLGEYHDLYVSLDVALLADVFENFRDTTINIDKLDPAYYLSAPDLSWH